jgi:2-C-methyl-D-erythritol 4-phosphate cytidylyltransferase
MSCHLIIPAAGVGKRMAADRPKQYLPLAGATVIEVTLQRFLAVEWIDSIRVVVSPEDVWWPALPIADNQRIIRVAGGAERYDSVTNALADLALTAAADDWVLVHDAARPCLRDSDLQQLYRQLAEDAVGGILAVPVRDTMKRDNGHGAVATTVDRNGLWHALTPQMFRFSVLQAALAACKAAAMAVTDEASAIEMMGLSPRLVEGRGDNIKITRPEDLALASFYLSH